MARSHSATTHWSGYRSNSQADINARNMADDKLAKQTDESIDRYVQTCRKPGGGEEGFTCPMDSVELLKLAAFGGKHMDRIYRVFDAEMITKEWCTSWQDQVDLKKKWDNKVSADEYPKAESAKTPAKLFKALETLFGCMHGVTGIPLLYVVRTEVEPPDEDEVRPWERPIPPT